MTLLDFHADLKKTNEMLERIAIALEIIAGPLVEGEPETAKQLTKTTPDMIRRVDVSGEKRTMERLRKIGE